MLLLAGKHSKLKKVVATILAISTVVSLGALPCSAALTIGETTYSGYPLPPSSDYWENRYWYSYGQNGYYDPYNYYGYYYDYIYGDSWYWDSWEDWKDYYWDNYWDWDDYWDSYEDWEDYWDTWYEDWYDGYWIDWDEGYTDYVPATQYPYFYPKSGAQITHDGHGNFDVNTNAFSSVSGATMVVTADDSHSEGLVDGYPGYPDTWQGNSGATSQGGYYNGGVYSGGTYTVSNVVEGSRLGTLSFLGNTMGVYEGTSNANMGKGAGHFIGTSAWDGNVCFAGHNRGPDAYFYDLKDIKVGDIITYSTSYGTRTYSVTSRRVVSVNDLSPLNASNQNMLTLVTCVANEPSIRLAVQAVQIG